MAFPRQVEVFGRREIKLMGSHPNRYKLDVSMRYVPLALALLFTDFACLAQTPAPPEVPENVTLDQNIPYSDVLGGAVQMDVTRPKSPGTHPLVVLIHGGGFRRGNRSSYLPLAIRLAQEGFVAATISYRFSPKFQFPAHLHDAKSAVRFLRANSRRFSIDGARVCALGSSAGGHLALMLGLTAGVSQFEGDGPNPTQSSRINCVVSYAGPTDFTRIYAKGFDAADVLPQYLGGDLRTALSAHINSSPISWVSPDDAPVLFVHGTADNYVPYEQVLWLAERLSQVGVETEVASFPGGGHGLRDQQKTDADNRAVAYLKSKLMPTATSRRLWVANHGRNGAALLIDWPSGRVIRSIPNNGGHDVQPLANGNVLITTARASRVAEYAPNGLEVWSLSAMNGIKYPVCASRLPSGNTLVSDTMASRVVEYAHNGKEVWQFTDPSFKPNYIRCARPTPSGTVLIANEHDSTILEVDRAGKTVWRWQMPDAAHRRTYQAVRLAGGTTAVSISEPGELLFLDKAGKIIRTIGAGDDLTRGIKFGWASGFHIQPDGSVFISDYSGRRIVEINAKGELVNELRTPDWAVASVWVP